MAEWDQMKNCLIALLFALVLQPACSKELETQMLGKWQSNEEKTLDDMRKTKDIPARTRKFFENNFFGRLILVIREGESSSYFADDKNLNIEFAPYEIIKKGDNYLIIKDFNSVLNKIEEQQWFFEKDCMYTYVSKWKFREYFCPRNE
ncbi:hypothetical protein [Chitinibacter sp. S2-10]|uniref:hypothetical protein n=1 Tax=Chitinibacter sp. S2-10 TaxID=3373597 RepID=UPI0039776952